MNTKSFRASIRERAQSMSIISRGKKWVAGLAIATALFGVSLVFVPPATANTDQQTDADTFDAG